MLNKEFLSKISDFIVSHKLLRSNAKYLVALSGGADSVALLLSLHSLGYDIEAVHCNFHLRGDESDNDELFCENLCKDKNIPFHRVHFDTTFYARQHKISIEMAARELRYKHFENLRKDINADGICVGHHQNDSVETILLNIIRGTGIHGLKGILPVNGNIIRPLLCVTRDEIEESLRLSGYHFVTDSTNLTDDYTRNKIRLNIIPHAEAINPSFNRNMAKLSQRVGDVLSVFDDFIAKSINDITFTVDNNLYIDIEKLQKLKSSEYILFTILRKYSFTSLQVEEIYNNIKAKTGTVYLSESHRLLFDRNHLIIDKIRDFRNNIVVKMPEPGLYVKENYRVRVEIIDNTSGDEIKFHKDALYADASLVKFPLTLRYPQEGDWFVPLGMKGKKLLSDYFTDNKISLFDREKQLVISDNDDKIIWIVGKRTDERTKISPRTKSIVRISFAYK